MSFEPVNVVVLTEAGNPVSDVLVKIYDPAGSVFYTQSTTNAEGIASFLLETLSYSMRFYKFQVGFSQPQNFTVLESPEINIFDVVVEPFISPLATDPRLCRCSGFFRSIDGSPKRYLDMHILSEFEPMLLNESAVIPEEVHIRTNEEGYAQIDLIRGGNYYVNLESFGAVNLRRFCRIPDAASANLPDVLFPRVASILLEESYSLSVGEILELTPEIFDSAGRPMTGTASDDLTWKLEGDAIATLIVGAEKLTITANQAGAVQLTATRKDSTIIKIPDLPITGIPITITIS